MNRELEPTAKPLQQAERGVGIGNAPGLRPEVFPERLPPCKTGSGWPRILARFQGVPVYRWQDNGLMWTSGARSVPYGSPRAFHPAVDQRALAPLGPERLRGAHGLVRGDNGAFILQGPRDPNPGFMVSRTDLEIRDFHPHDPRRYVDAEAVRYCTVPLDAMIQAHEKGLPPILGAEAVVMRLDNNTFFHCVVAGIDRQGIGAISHKLARDLGLGPQPDAGKAEGFWFKVWPGHVFDGYELQEWRPE